MLALRTADGVHGAAFSERFGMEFAPFEKRLRDLSASNLTEQTADGWRLTEQGFLVSNSVINYVIQ